MAENTTAFQALLDEDIEIQLKENRDVGETWKLEYNIWAMRVIKDDYSIPRLRFRTTRGTRTLTFRLYKTGEYQIKCRCMGPNGDTLETKIYNVKCHR